MPVSQMTQAPGLRSLSCSNLPQDVGQEYCKEQEIAGDLEAHDQSRALRIPRRGKYQDRVEQSVGVRAPAGEFVPSGKNKYQLHYVAQKQKQGALR